MAGMDGDDEMVEVRGKKKTGKTAEKGRNGGRNEIAKDGSRALRGPVEKFHVATQKKKGKILRD